MTARAAANDNAPDRWSPRAAIVAIVLTAAALWAIGFALATFVVRAIL